MINIENKNFLLQLGEDGVAYSLVMKSTGEECLDKNNLIPAFSVTQERPFNNEIKLIYPNKRTTFSANSVEREGNNLIVSFELISIKAVVEITEKDDYIAFELTGFIISEGAYGSFCLEINPPPFLEFRLLQLPVAERERFGDWLNVAWDDKCAVNILSTSPYALIDAEKRNGCYVMYANALRDVKLIGSSAALIVSTPDKLLDCIESMEKDYDLPRGVESRRSENMDASIYWVDDINPSNADEHIKCALQGGFTRMLIYYPSFFKDDRYYYTGDYDYNENYPNGADDLKTTLDKIKSAGIIPGFHFLHPHVGIKSRYITPVADHRLNLKKYFTLAGPLGTDDDIIYVEQNPEGSPLTSEFQVLKFDGEIIHYDSYSTEYPYCFKGCSRGYYNTDVTEHKLGVIGGILDVSEFGARSVYTDERTSLQDELAVKISNAYNLGFEFIYFDGSEGTNPPFEFNVPYAQYRVYSKLNTKPRFCEGAAKSHFGWHMLSGGNAFDIFPAKVFKEKIAEYPLSAAPIVANNFTRINFGWWKFDTDTQPDMYEYGTGKAAACDCPATVMIQLDRIAKNPRRDDVLEVMYRWEDVRRKKWLTPEQKELLKNPDAEYILLVNQEGEYELVPYFSIKNAIDDDGKITAYYFVHDGKNYVVCWHATGSGKLSIDFHGDFVYSGRIGGTEIETQRINGRLVIPVDGRRYFATSLPADELVKAFENAELID